MQEKYLLSLLELGLNQNVVSENIRLFCRLCKLTATSKICCVEQKVCKLTQATCTLLMVGTFQGRLRSLLPGIDSRRCFEFTILNYKPRSSPNMLEFSQVGNNIRIEVSHEIMF